MTACPPWCRVYLSHKSESVRVEYGNQIVCCWLQHEPGGDVTMVGLSATYWGFGAPAVVLPTAVAGEVADGLVQLIRMS